MGGFDGEGLGGSKACGYLLWLPRVTPAASIVGWHRRFDEAEVELNGRLGRIHQLVAATATATSSMSTGTGDRADDEQDDLLKFLDPSDDLQ